ncbi:MAG TPA: PEGA domain-containing protein [Sandaracinaceae bacterium LLY-WYZ-13_1]|nr:PEGA domain-containing protein [Sandaracinaceae bacterium LLY-WYZ-13_1]
MTERCIVFYRAVLGVALGAGLLAAAPAMAQPAPIPAEARERQARGRALLDADDPNGALAEFERVYELLEGHPRRHLVLSNIGRCYQLLGQYDRAMRYYERYLSEAGPDAPDRVRVRASIDALNDLLGTVEVRTNVAEAEVWVDDRQLGTAPGAVRVPAGRHTVELRARGHAPARREVQLAARQSVAIALELEPLGEASGIDPAFFWSGLALTAATGAAGLTLGGFWLARHDENAGRIADGRAVADDVNAERDLALAADVLYGVTGGLAIATAILGFVTRWEDSGDGDEAPSVGVDAAVGPGHVALRLRGALP